MGVNYSLGMIDYHLQQIHFNLESVAVSLDTLVKVVERAEASIRAPFNLLKSVFVREPSAPQA